WLCHQVRSHRYCSVYFWWTRFTYSCVGSKCVSDCSCMACTLPDTGCAIWFGDLIDIAVFHSGEQDLYIRMQTAYLIKILQNY
ncbi:LOW QUALITY PROTEIN: PAN/Apple domain containing protein, partial [Trema orientale]